jgi:hypothetical protein
MTMIVSVAHLFATGRLGPLNAGLSLQDAATALGPPVSWSLRHEPLHGEVWVWHYDDLKLVFATNAPWRLLFVSVEGLRYVGERNLLVRNAHGGAMLVEFDGINKETSPSDALTRICQRGQPPQVLYWPLGRDDTLDPSLLIIAAGDVAVAFEVWDDEAGGNAELAKLTDAELWSILEAHAHVDRLMCGMHASLAPAAAITPRRLDVAERQPGPSRANAGDFASTTVHAGPSSVLFTDFLATGRLGPVHCGLSRNQLAFVLGPPKYWTGTYEDENVLRESAEWPAGAEPRFPDSWWSYDELEITFDPAPPHGTTFIKIGPTSLHGDCGILADGRIILILQGLNGNSRPGDFLRQMRDGEKPLHVIYSRPSTTGSFVLQISNATVVVVFDNEFPDEILSSLASLDEAAYLRHCDRFAKLHGIYAWRINVEPEPDRSSSSTTVAAAAYLAAMTEAALRNDETRTGF